MSTKYSDTEIHRFIKSYVKSKDGEIAQQSDEVFTVTYPNEENPKEYTYQPALAREKKIPLITPGSATFQQILKECLENGVLCQISLKPKGEIETALKGYFKDSPFSCENCDKVAVGEEVISTCTKSPPCFHMINNGKIVSVKIVKNDPTRYFQFYFSATFQNKLRPKNEETITILVDEEGNVVNAQDFNEDVILKNEALEIQDFKSKLDAAVFDKLKTATEEKLGIILKEKLVPFDLALSKEKKSKLRSFDKRLRRERREKVISRKHDFDIPQWRASYETLLKREEESLITNIAVKLINLLVINTAKIYSKKAALTLDETLNEYFEHDSGFVCAVCGKRHSRLLEFKCSHDNSSVCIHHYGFCDVCGKVFSKLNLTYTDEFKRQLCPKHASKNKAKEH